MTDAHKTTNRQGTATFTYSESLAPYSLPMKEVLSRVHDGKIKWLATGVLVFRKDRLLLLQRALHDSFPGFWETPGGGCDEEDETVLHSAARELMEEAGLTAVKFVRQVGEIDMFRSASGKDVARPYFQVEIQDAENEGIAVRLDPNEHQNFVWVTEEELEQGRAGSIQLADIINKPTLLEGFRLRKSRLDQ